MLIEGSDWLESELWELEPCEELGSSEETELSIGPEVSSAIGYGVSQDVGEGDELCAEAMTLSVIVSSSMLSNRIDNFMIFIINFELS
jgi:hypothetical protein